MRNGNDQPEQIELFENDRQARLQALYEGFTSLEAQHDLDEAERAIEMMQERL